jgi:hypothetical protein
MLTNDQITAVWERRIAAEVRSLYFGELANRYSKRKQWFTGLTFFFSSGAAATVVARLPAWIPVLLSVLVAAITAYSIAVSLDASIRSMAKFHYSWSQLAADYERLWNHTYSDEAGDDFERIAARERDLSELATTEAPNDPSRLGYWQEQVFRQHHLVSEGTSQA